MSNSPQIRPNEARLVVRCQLGEQDAWQDLVRTWNPSLVSFFDRMTNNEAKRDDLLQNTWLQIVRTITRLDQPESFGPWVYRIARNTLTDHLRKQYRSPRTVSWEADVEQSENDFVLDRWIESDDLARAMQTLHPEEREVVALHYFEHLTVAEVADVCNSPVGTIKSRLVRARRQLRIQLEKEQSR